ncbi:extracellular catalytic domain type 1 short-chain-length polyhydroxyalkanoate depolymerase [Sorangium sp. So ce1097]|uniref:extracellular catalytic domain type 1 short-chain-length polyhydroxyalkanoate depolymerase n=1 Tax=Sorangium sp. So ce1097 TaxID=3133330 RepID=UPI003F63EDEB
MNQFQRHILGLASLSSALLAALPARGASLQQVNQSEWRADGLPSYVNMYIYVPDRLAAKPPIVVAPHHCQGTGPGTFSEMSSLVSIANTSGFIMIFPEATGQNCWDAGSTRSLNHGGGGDTGAIVQMVKYTLAKYNGDAGRVYAVGGSSGGIMTEALLGVYPDVFMAGVSLMGVPCGCWAEGYNDVTGTGSTAQWSGPCGAGNVTKTGQQWGDLVRSYYPGYTGHRPRLQHWHGTADTILSYKNMAEDVKEWTNVLGLSETPDGTDTPKPGTTRQFWKSSCGYTVYEAFSMDGVGHAVPFDGPAVAAYFGLDEAGGQDPETAACPGAVPGGGGAGGAGGGAGGAGGGAGGAGGGAGGAGGAAGTGGAGGAMENGSGGSAGSGGAIDTGAGGAIGQDASSGAGDSTGGESSSSGCSCALGDGARDSGAQAGLLLAALGLLLGRTKRRRRCA